VPGLFSFWSDRGHPRPGNRPESSSRRTGRGSQLYRQYPQERQACRAAGRAADQARVRHQPENRQCARHRSAGNAARPRRRGDRMMHLATQDNWIADDGVGSLSAAEHRDRHGRTQSLACGRLMHRSAGAVSAATGSPGTGRRCGRPWLRKWARAAHNPSSRNTGNRCSLIRELPAGRAAVPPISGSVGAIGARAFWIQFCVGRRTRQCAALAFIVGSTP
jgi:hypothetical protein